MLADLWKPLPRKTFEYLANNFIRQGSTTIITGGLVYSIDYLSNLFHLELVSDTVKFAVPSNNPYSQDFRVFYVHKSVSQTNYWIHTRVLERSKIVIEYYVRNSLSQSKRERIVKHILISISNLKNTLRNKSQQYQIRQLTRSASVWSEEIRSLKRLVIFAFIVAYIVGYLVGTNSQTSRSWEKHLQRTSYKKFDFSEL